LDGNLSSILIGSKKDEEAIDWCKRILKLSLDKGEQAWSWRLTKEEGIVCMGKNEKEEENEV
jgi:hypothetical protein